MLRLDGGDPLIHGRWHQPKVCRAQLLHISERDDPVAIGRSVEGDDLDHVGQLGAVGPKLGDLGVVLRKDEAALGVADDVGHVELGGRRIDRGRRRASKHHRKVGNHPLVPGARRKRHTLLRLDAQCDQTGGQPAHPVIGLRPGHRLPGGALWEPEGLRVRRLRHPVDEQVRHRTGPVLDDGEVIALVGR